MGPNPPAKPGRQSQRINPSNNTNLNRDEIVKDQQVKIKTFEEASNWLEEKILIPSKDDISTLALSNALLFLSNTHSGIPKIVVEGMRAIAICMEKVSMEHVASKITESVLEAIHPTMSDTMDTVNNWTSNANKILEEAKDEYKEIAQKVETIVEKMTRLNTERPSDATHTNTTEKGTMNTRTLDLGHTEALAKGEKRGRQVLVDATEDSRSNETLRNLTEKLLVEKANMALSIAGDEEGKPADAKFTSARKLNNGGILYEMNNKKAAEWLRSQTGKERFTKGFGTDITLKDRTFTVLAQFVPCSLEINQSTMATMEQENHIAKNTIYEVKWIRPPGSRAPGQRVANLVIVTNSPDTANHLIRQGLTVEGTKTPVRKLEQDPVRCLKCQTYGTSHMAAKCKQDHDTCGTCAGSHRTSQCEEKNLDKRSCVSCKEHGHQHNHASWDKTCPAYLEAKRKLDERNPETGYKYFLTEDPTTWIKEGTAPAPGKHGGSGWTNTRSWNARATDSGWKGATELGSTRATEKERQEKEKRERRAEKGKANKVSNGQTHLDAYMNRQTRPSETQSKRLLDWDLDDSDEEETGNGGLQKTINKNPANHGAHPTNTSTNAAGPSSAP